MQRQHPATFGRPSPAELDNINPGTSVKICAGNERFWTTVTERTGDVLTGTVDNFLLFSRLQYGDKIKFHPDNIFNIHQKEPAR